MKKGKNGGLVAALSTLLISMSKVATVDEINKKPFNMKAGMENAPAILESLVNITDKEIALVSTGFRAVSLGSKEGSTALIEQNKTVQAYLLFVAKSKKVKKLIKSNM